MSDQPYGAPGGDHRLSVTHSTVKEATDHALEIRAANRAIEGSHGWREQQRVEGGHRNG